MKRLSFLLLIFSVLLSVFALSLLAAEEGNAYVTAIEDIDSLSSLAAKEQAVIAAEEFYPGDEYLTEPDIKAAREKANAVLWAVACCNDYIAAAQELLLLDSEEYAVILASVNKENKKRALADMEYPGVSQAYKAVLSILGEFEERERVTAKFLESVKAAEGKDGYAQIKRGLDDSKMLLANEKLITDHPSAVEAMEIIERIENTLWNMRTDAAAFLIAVEEMTGENIYEALMSVLPYYEATDSTVTGVGEVYDMFSGEVNSYNSKVSDINAFIRGE